MATKLQVTYADGRKVKILATPRAQVETERHFRGQGIAELNRVEAGYRLAWGSLHYAGKESAEFEQWLDQVADVDQIDLDEADEAATDPTPETPQPTGSLD